MVKIVCLILLICPATFAADSPNITQAELVKRTQQLYDALPSGDQGPWKLYFADDAMIFDEKGRDFNKSQLLEDTQPMPAGYTLVLQVVNPKVLISPGVAILSYDCDERESVFGQALTARYHTTDTWLYRKNVWQIVASQTLRYYQDPPAGTVSEATLRDYVGTYQLTPGTVLTVTQKNGELFAQRGAGKPSQMFPESVDVFFRPGVEGRRLFHRDASGHVDTLIDRRNNEDLVWKKVG